VWCAGIGSLDLGGWFLEEKRKFLLGFFCVCYVRPHRSHDESRYGTRLSSSSSFSSSAAALVHRCTENGMDESRIYIHTICRAEPNSRYVFDAILARHGVQPTTPSSQPPRVEHRSCMSCLLLVSSFFLVRHCCLHCNIFP
jgi:hypothetical protein